MDKVVGSVVEAVSGIADGASIAVGGFALAGFPTELLEALAEGEQSDLHLIANGMRGAAVEKLLAGNRVRKFSGGFVFAGPWRDAVLSGGLEVEVVPQGTLSERLRSGGAGIPGFYTPTSTGTLLETGGFPKRFDSEGNPTEFTDPKEVREFDGRSYVFERAIKPDYGFVKATKADRSGNLIFRLTSRNFNPFVAMAARCTIVQAEEIVEIGELEPDEIHVPGCFVDVIVHTPRPAVTPPPPERRASRPREAVVGFSREEIAQCIGRDIEAGWCINLGIGIPLLAAKFVDPDKDVRLHLENGILGAGDVPEVPDPDLTDASGQPVSLRVGAAIFDSAMSFAIVRGGQLDLTVLGGLQVSAKGDLANWYLPRGETGVGGAMDLARGAQHVWVAMEHTDRDGSPKILEECTLALTGPNVVDRVYTNLGVFSIDDDGLELIQRAPGVEIDYIQERTGAPIRVHEGI